MTPRRDGPRPQCDASDRFFTSQPLPPGTLPRGQRLISYPLTASVMCWSSVAPLEASGAPIKTSARMTRRPCIASGFSGEAEWSSAKDAASAVDRREPTAVGCILETKCFERGNGRDALLVDRHGSPPAFATPRVDVSNLRCEQGSRPERPIQCDTARAGSTPNTCSSQASSARTVRDLSAATVVAQRCRVERGVFWLDFAKSLATWVDNP